jgi:hypothetical protein
MARREPPLRIPLDFDETLRGLLQTPPPPAGTMGSRKELPKRKRKTANRKAAKKR